MFRILLSIVPFFRCLCVSFTYTPILNNHANAAGLQQHKLHLASLQSTPVEEDPFSFSSAISGARAKCRRIHTQPTLQNASRKCGPFANLRPCSSGMAGPGTITCTSHKTARCVHNQELVSQSNGSFQHKNLERAFRPRRDPHLTGKPI